MEVFNKTDIGLMRAENQDSQGSGVISQNCVWSVVCDGMGGANGGSVASSMAVDIISKEINSKYKDEYEKEELSNFLIETVALANLKIFEKSKTDITLTGMGTTCDLVLIKDTVIHIVHVGDSRTYSIRDKKIKQLTEDHSVVQEMVRRGELTQEEAENHPNKNFITRALGIKPHIHIDYIEANYNDGDIIVICSDGLSNELTTEKIFKIIKESRKEESTENLVQEALNLGGHDNITVSILC